MMMVQDQQMMVHEHQQQRPQMMLQQQQQQQLQQMQQQMMSMSGMPVLLSVMYVISVNHICLIDGDMAVTWLSQLSQSR